ncbi:TolC family protein [Notoacmeibacter sp. MSK16QG-6]|uniref:TolC family protein n=1 Tax=Notoacmeibacter sp. MSK16QG-6 TaxID=2957982 RepID=UPI00209FB23A|nr:TolC family protein [Notoacmeibacter sp. MSK16QG-6]MCP1198644.1 TolC family protein [Notoacmeibacter sp. MSK16QG-6]
MRKSSRACQPFGLRIVGPTVASAIFLSACSVTTEPLSFLQVETAANQNLASLDIDQEPIDGPIGLYEAMARALKYNLDHRVEVMRIALAQKELASATTGMLPKLMASAGYDMRSNENASYSRSIFSNSLSAEPTTSTEKSNVSADLKFSYNVLDFGLSYVRAKQSADKALIAEELRRRVVVRIVEEVRTAYWKALSADQLLDGFSRLEGQVKKTLDDNRRLRASGQTSPLATLTYERELVDIRREIGQVERQLKTAKLELAGLMGLRPGTAYKIIEPKRTIVDLDTRLQDIDTLLQIALTNRSEFREILYKKRINEAETRAALLEALPTASLTAGVAYDSNDLLYNSNWALLGTRIGWNAMKLFQYPARRKMVKADRELLAAQEKALTMAIVTQVYVAKARYAHLRREAIDTAEFLDIQRQILRQTQAGMAAAAQSQQTLIREEMNTLVASSRFDVAYADLQTAFANVYAALGLNPWDEDVDLASSLREIASALRAAWRERGDLDG